MAGRTAAGRWPRPPTTSRSISSPSSPAPPSRPCTARGSLVLPADDDAAALYEATAETASRHGLHAYEISNYAAPGAESRHNLAYWRYGDYAGIGPGAHGRLMLGGRAVATRRHRAPEPWASRVEREGHGSTAEEVIAPADRAREMLLMGLRLTRRRCATRFDRRTGLTLASALDAEVLAMAVAEGYLETPADHLVATAEGRLRLDALLPALLR